MKSSRKSPNRRASAGVFIFATSFSWWFPSKLTSQPALAGLFLLTREARLKPAQEHSLRTPPAEAGGKADMPTEVRQEEALFASFPSWSWE